MQFLEFKFKGQVEGNQSDHNVRHGSRLINKMEKLKYLGSIVQENGKTVEDVTSST